MRATVQALLIGVIALGAANVSAAPRKAAGKDPFGELFAPAKAGKQPAKAAAKSKPKAAAASRPKQGSLVAEAGAPGASLRAGHQPAQVLTTDYAGGRHALAGP